MRILVWTQRIEVGILVGGMVFTIIGRFFWGLLATGAVWGLFRFVLWATTIMSCPHCDGMLWDLWRRVEEIIFCPYCGRRLDPRPGDRRE